MLEVVMEIGMPKFKQVVVFGISYVQELLLCEEELCMVNCADCITFDYSVDELLE